MTTIRKIKHNQSIMDRLDELRIKYDALLYGLVSKRWSISNDFINNRIKDVELEIDELEKQLNI